MRGCMRTSVSLVLAVATAVAMAVGAQAAAMFSDIGSSPFAQAIVKVAVPGVMSGNADGTFQPDQPITRLQAVQALAAGLNVQGAGSIPNYKDLSEIPDDVRPVIAALLNTGAASQQTSQVKDGNISYTLTTDKAVYGVDDPVDLTFTIANAGTTDQSFEFPSTQNYDFIVRQGTTEIARWSLGQTFVQTPTSLVLAGGKSFSFTTRWLQKDQDSRTRSARHLHAARDVPPEGPPGAGEPGLPEGPVDDVPGQHVPAERAGEPRRIRGAARPGDGIAGRGDAEGAGNALGQGRGGRARTAARLRRGGDRPQDHAAAPGRDVGAERADDAGRRLRGRSPWSWTRSTSSTTSRGRS